MTYSVHAFYSDPEISIKNAKNEPQDIIMANVNYNLSIKADDMKKAYDIAVQYMPVGAKITAIEEDHYMTSRTRAVC